MTDEVTAALTQIHGLYGHGTPQRTTSAGGPVRAVAATDPTHTDPSWSGVAKDGYTARQHTNSANGTALADADDAIPTPVASSAEATAGGRAALDTTADNYHTGKAVLAPAAGTPSGQAAMLTLKAHTLKRGTDTVADSQRTSATRSAAVRQYAAKYFQQLAAQQQQGATQTAAAQQQAAMQQAAMQRAAQQQAAMQQAAMQQAQLRQAAQIAATTTATAPTSLLSGTGGTRRSLSDPITPTHSGGASTTAGAKTVKAALSQLGVPYVWGGGGIHGPSGGGFDCSSLTQYSYKEGAGIELPRTTYEQIKLGERISPAQAQPGDLVFSNFSSPGTPEHVQLAMGGGKVVEAPHTGANVQVSTMPSNVIVKRIIK